MKFLSFFFSSFFFLADWEDKIDEKNHIFPDENSRWLIVTAPVHLHIVTISHFYRKMHLRMPKKELFRLAFLGIGT